MAEFIRAPGAWPGAWARYEVVPQLRAAGPGAHALTLSEPARLSRPLGELSSTSIMCLLDRPQPRDDVVELLKSERRRLVERNTGHWPMFSQAPGTGPGPARVGGARALASEPDAGAGQGLMPYQPGFAPLAALARAPGYRWEVPPRCVGRKPE